jgi:CheY-like chemotaxis protein/HPt (histidine-containing phosphotransfer) domain-containing protein
LRQILTNLIGNAIKFTARGEVRMEAKLQSQSQGKATVRFAIADTGIGLPAGQEAQLFSPFVQADVSTTRKYGGSGLGLAICKHLVELMGGTIGVDSKEGQGSTFWFTAVLDLASTLQPSPCGQSLPLDSSEPAARLAGGPQKRILVAEDNATNRNVLLAQLRKLGYQATAVANGAEAVEAVQRDPYDLVRMDCQMPVMNGFEAHRRIRAMRPDLAVVAVTADAMPADQDRCLREGMNDYLAKPVDLGQLANVLTKWLPGPTKVVFDSEALLRRLMGDRKLAGTILKGFLDDVPSQLNNLRMLLAAADASGAQLQAHALGGGAATVAALSLHAVAKEMERAGTDGQLDQCCQLLPCAVEEFERFKTTLEQAQWV